MNSMLELNRYSIIFLTKSIIIINMSDISEGEALYIKAQSLRLVVANLRKVVYIFPLTMSVLASLFWGYIDYLILVSWLASVFGISIYRFIVHKQIESSDISAENYALFLNKILLLDFASGFILGLSGYFLLFIPQELQWLVVLVFATISMNVVAAQSAIKISVLTFNIPLYVGFIFWLIIAGKPLDYIIIALVLLHGLFLYGHFKSLHQHIIRGFKLTYKNKKLAKALLEKNKQLALSNQQVQASSLAKSQFIADIGQQLAMPLEGMLEQLDISQQAFQLSDSKMYIKSAQATGSTLLNLLNDLLDVNRLEQGMISAQTELFSVRNHFENIVSLVALSAEHKGLLLYCNIHPNVPSFIESDPLRLSQITLNLLTNAIKFTEQGEVGITLYLSGIKGKEELVIEVSDTGIGIDENLKKIIFQPFVHGKAKVERVGNGLGLAISQALCQLLNGTITLISEPNKGSIFSCHIPILQHKNEPVPIGLLQQKVLLVEKQGKHKQSIINQLRYLKIPYDLVHSAKEAMPLCTNQHKYQAVIIGEQERLQQKLLVNLCLRIKLKAIVLTTLSKIEHFDDKVLTLYYPLKTEALTSAVADKK
jgi:signal transduction histidine kinase